MKHHFSEYEDYVSEYEDYVSEQPNGSYDRDANRYDHFKSQTLRVLRSDQSLLILGETGAGKTEFAKWVHEISRGRTAPFMSRGCASMLDAGFADTLFGHDEQAFTGATKTTDGLIAQVAGGSFVLEDVDTLTGLQQATLLSFLDDRRVTPLGPGSTSFQANVRLMFTTNKNLKDLVDGGLFREDLYYRIARFPLIVPSLRDREDDIPQLIDAYRREFDLGMGDGAESRQFSANAIAFMQILPWTGNMRELRNTVELILMYDDRTSTKPISIEQCVALLELSLQGKSILEELRTTAQAHPDLIRRVLEACGGNKSLAGRIVGLSRPTLYKVIEQNGWTCGNL